VSDSQTEWWAPVRPDGTGDAPAAPPRRRDRERHRAARKRRSRRRTTWAVVIVLAVVGTAGYLVWSMVDGLFDGGSASATPSDFPGPGGEAVEIVVNPGDSGQAIGRTLADAGVVATANAFVSAYAANPAATGIQPGTYSLLTQIPAADAVQALLNPASRIEDKLTIAEGLTARQIYEKVAAEFATTADDVAATVGDGAAIGLPEQAGGKVEGWLFPATYTVQPGDDVTSVLTAMTAQTVKVLTDLGAQPDTWETTLIKASLVEREAKHDEDRPKMARAIDNRLADDWRLDIDAAVAYGAGVSGTELTKAMLDDTSNPYNLRRLKGLPPTPIASPGAASIKAVLEPADGTWMYWCTVNLETGETWFSTTEAEHSQCVAAMNDWLAANPKS